MKTLKYLSWLVILSSILSSCLFAEETDLQKPLTLQECLDLAYQANVDTLTAGNNVVAARSRYTRAKSDYFPQVSLQNNAFTYNSTSVLNKVSNGTALTVTQNLFDGGLREANVKNAKESANQTRYSSLRTRQTVSYNVSKAYYEVLRSRHLESIAKANVTYNEELQRQIKARVDVGDAAKIDSLPVDAQLASARVNLLSSQNSVRTSLIQLESLMGLSPQQGFDVQEIDTSPSVEIDPLESYVEDAFRARPDIPQYKAAVKAAQASTKSAKLALYPLPTVSAQYQRQISGGFTTDGVQVVGGIAFDIFDGGANRASYKEARANQSNAEISRDQTLKDIRSQVEEAYLNLTNARERLSASAISLESANKNYLAQQERYAQGLGTTLDLLNAEVQLVTAQSDEIQARYDYYIAIAQIDYAVGN